MEVDLSLILLWGCDKEKAGCIKSLVLELGKSHSNVSSCATGLSEAMKVS